MNNTVYKYVSRLVLVYRYRRHPLLLLSLHVQVLCQMTKKERTCIKYGLLPPKIAESDAVSLIHGLCGSGGSRPFQIMTQAKTHSMLALTMIDQATGWFEIIKAQISQQYPSRICFITPGWHVIVEFLILRKLSKPCKGPYLVTSVYKNGTIRIQKEIVSERVNIRRITPFNQKPN
jgi:hypothetical protein